MKYIGKDQNVFKMCNKISKLSDIVPFKELPKGSCNKFTPLPLQLEEHRKLIL